MYARRSDVSYRFRYLFINFAPTVAEASHDEMNIRIHATNAGAGARSSWRHGAAVRADPIAIRVVVAVAVHRRLAARRLLVVAPAALLAAVLLFGLLLPALLFTH